MTTNYHTPISIGAPANASTFNAPLGQLDSAIDTAITSANSAITSANTNTTNLNNLKSGADGFSQLSLTTSTTLTISSGQITVTRSRQLVDTEASASWDDLDTINGGVAGDVLVLQSVTSARVVVVKHNTGNIFLNGFDVFLDNPRKALTLLHDGTQWVLVGHPPAQINRRQMRVIFDDGSQATVGHPIISIHGTPSNVFEVDGSYTQYLSAPTAASIAGVLSNSGTLFQTRHNPTFIAWIRMGSNVAGMRFYIGIHTGGIYGAADNLPSIGTQGAVFRYSTVAGDSGFRPVTSNGTTQTVGAVMATASTNTAYKLQVSIINGVAYFSVNDDVPVVVSATTPASTTGLGWNAHLQTQENVAKSLLIKQILVETD